MPPRIPSPDVFELRDLPTPRLSDRNVERSIGNLRRLCAERGVGGNGGLIDKVERLKKRLQLCWQNDGDWLDATDVPQREWALIRLYTLHLGTTGADQWLCGFKEEVADSVLGVDATRWHRARRRDVANLFFVQFDRIECLDRLAVMLRSAWSVAERTAHHSAAEMWAMHSGDLFATDGPERIAAHWSPGETIEDLASRFFIPQTSLFRDHLINAVLLRRLAEIPLFHKGIELFGEIERLKNRVFRDGRLLGCRAVEILLDRVINEGRGAWHENWSCQIVPFACHPRTLNTGERQRWWGWANPQQMESALKGLTDLNIREFIRLLEGSLIGTGNEHQFPARRDFLLRMFGANVIEEAKLVVNTEFYDRLDAATRRSLQPSRSRGQQTSFICLKCSGGLYLIEGTHSFGMRGFLGERRFPIENFWTNPPQPYNGALFRTDQSRCDIYQRHTRGWERSFLFTLRRNLHIEWPGMY